MESPIQGIPARIANLSARAEVWENRYNRTDIEECSVIAVALRALSQKLTPETKSIKTKLDIVDTCLEGLNERSNKILLIEAAKTMTVMSQVFDRFDERMSVTSPQSEFVLNTIKSSPPIVQIGAGGGGAPKDLLKKMKPPKFDKIFNIQINATDFKIRSPIQPNPINLKPKVIFPTDPNAISDSLVMNNEGPRQTVLDECPGFNVTP